MEFANRLNQILHDEHDKTSALIEQLEQLIVRKSGDVSLDAGEPGVARLLSELAVWAESEIDRHFSFEEEHLFSYLAAGGNSAIADSLTHEHQVIRQLAARIAALAHDAAGRPLGAGEWTEFRRLGRELCSALEAHIQKEEMGLLPVLEDDMDPDTELRLYQDYVDSL